jgi:ABC-2 type transport system ATP-binding protein
VALVDETAIRTVGLTKRYGDVEALSSLDLEVCRGEVLGYLGPNGAGKTTTMRLLLNLARPTAGRAEIFGLDVTHDAVAAHRRIAYVPGDVALWPSLTGAETLHLLGRLHGRVDDAYRDQLIEDFALDPSKKVRAYSKGNRQKIALIAAMMTRADLLILDEPTSGLDPLMEQVFRRHVIDARAQGQTVLLSSHILSEAEAVCDRVAILRAGHLIETRTLAEMRSLAAVTIEAILAGSPPDLSNVPRIDAIEIVGNRLRCRVYGNMEPLLDALRAAGVVKLLSHEASLEELFLAHYGEQAA